MICIALAASALLLWYRLGNSGGHGDGTDAKRPDAAVHEAVPSDSVDSTPQLPPSAKVAKSDLSKDTETADERPLEELLSPLHYPRLKEDAVPLDLTPGQADPLAQQIAAHLWSNFDSVNTITFSFTNTYADPDQQEKNSAGVVYFQRPFSLRKEGRGDSIAYRYVTDGTFQRKLIRTKGRPDFAEYETDRPDDANLESFLSDGMQVNIASLALLICPPSSFTSLGEEQWQGKDCFKIKSSGMVFWVDKASRQIEKVQLIRRGGHVLQEWRDFEYEKVPFAAARNGTEQAGEFLFPSKFDIVTTDEQNREVVRHRTIRDVRVNSDIPPSTFDLERESFRVDDLWEKEFGTTEREARGGVSND